MLPQGGEAVLVLSLKPSGLLAKSGVYVRFAPLTAIAKGYSFRLQWKPQGFSGVVFTEAAG